MNTLSTVQDIFSLVCSQWGYILKLVDWHLAEIEVRLFLMCDSLSETYFQNLVSMNNDKFWD